MSKIIWSILGLGIGIGIGYALSKVKTKEGPITNVLVNVRDSPDQLVHINTINLDTGEFKELAIISERYGTNTHIISLPLEYGNYDISFEWPLALIKRLNNVMIDGTNIDLGSLITGDLFRDNVISTDDFYLIQAKFGEVGDAPVENPFLTT